MANYGDHTLEEEFNRRLGRKTGNVKRPSKYVSTPRKGSAKYGRRGNRARIAAGTQKLPTEIKRKYAEQFGPESVGGGRDIVETFNKQMSGVFSDIERQALKQEQEQQLLEQNIALSQAAPPDDGFWDSFAKSPVGRAIDVVSRPFYGLSEGLQDVAEWGYEEGPNGQPQGEGVSGFLGSFPKFAGGFWEGFSGKEKTGPGDVWQTYVDGSQTLPAQELRKLEESHPEVYKRINQAVGLVGEVTLDPTNWVSGGAASLLKGTGQQLTEAALKEAATDIATKASTNFVQQITANLPANVTPPSSAAITRAAVKEAQEVAQNSFLEMLGGATRGRAKLDSRTFAPTIANKVGETLRQNWLSGFELRLKSLTSFWDQGKSITPGPLSQLKHSNPEFAKFLDALDAEYGVRNGDGVGRVYADVLSGRTSWKQTVARAAENTRATIDPQIQSVIDDAFQEAGNLTYNTVGVRLGSRKNSVTVPIKTVGKVYEKLKGSKRYPESFNRFMDAVSYERHFPGKNSLLIQRARSLGVKEFEAFRGELKKLAKQFSKDEAVKLQYALDEGVSLGSQKMDDALNDLMAMYDKIQTDELKGGARNISGEGSKRADNYAFVYNRKGSLKDRTEFKNKRKKQVHDTGGDTTGYRTADAKAAGLKPVENAFQAVLLRKLKSQRDLTRAYFLQDLLNNYGIYAPNLKTGSYEARKLAKVSENKLNEAKRALVSKGKSSWYLPQAHWDMYEDFENLSKLSNASLNQILRNLDKITGMYKTSVTVPFPGFHIRNMIGDFFMGLLDGVKTKTYEEVIRKAAASKVPGAHTPKFRITAGWDMDYPQLKADYEEHALGGFYNSAELPSAGVGGKVTHVPRAIGTGFREMSGKREDLGRITHYLHALRDETAQRVKRGQKLTDEVKAAATDAAVYRVNHYKFDYNALTATERKMKLAFPFYTYTRKAVPTLMESLALSPKWMGVAGRPFLDDGTAAGEFNSLYMPEWMKDAGFSLLTDEAEPFALTADVLPFGAANSLDFQNAEDLFGSVLAQANPIPTSFVEQAANKTFFSGANPPPLPQYLMDKLSLPVQARKLAENEYDEPLWEQLLKSRLGAGMPARRVTQEQQDFRYRQLEDEIIQDPFSEYNRSQDKFSVYRSSRLNGVDYQVKNRKTGRVVYKSRDLQAVLNWAQAHD